jgi:hypothetical protein
MREGLHVGVHGVEAVTQHVGVAALIGREPGREEGGVVVGVEGVGLAPAEELATSSYPLCWRRWLMAY